MARARQRRPGVTSAGTIAPAGAIASIAAATIAAAAATKPDFSDGNLGPDSTDGNLGPNGVAQNGSDTLHSTTFQSASDMCPDV